ncbi:hypothetical protein NL676_019213 [Syzygium grande]|nr:hypothetical protein NL676_019213 [Syzygium grande]
MESESTTDVPRSAVDAEVDVTEFTNSGNEESANAQDPDATEFSSSFGGTLSDSEYYSGMSEAEVDSQFCRDNDFPSALDAFDSMFRLRKKKLTDHWRTFIRPLMWRCKWTELRIKEIESQALKYAKELATFEQNKHLASDQCPDPVEEFGSKSMPFSGHCYKRKIMERRKRKKIEDITDIASYMSHHNLFSYLENKRSDPEGTFIADDFSNAVFSDKNRIVNTEFGHNDSQTSFEFKDGDIYLEQLLQKIETVHSRVHKLKGQLDVVITQNAAKFSSSENLSLLAPCEAQTSCAPSPTFSAGNGEVKSIGGVYSSAQHIPECDTGDFILPESVISSYGDAVPVPDVIESTVGLLSATNVTIQQPLVRDTSEDILENVLIHNELAEGESQMLKSSEVEALLKQLELDKGEQDESNDPSPVPASKPDPMVKGVASQQESTLKSCLASDINFPKNKRKRAERRSGSGGWTKKCPGEPDSQ